jgi:hypothetical protein
MTLNSGFITHEVPAWQSLFVMHGPQAIPMPVWHWCDALQMPPGQSVFVRHPSSQTAGDIDVLQ